MARQEIFGSSITLFRLFGFTVRLDASWIFIALLVTWSLAVGLFPLHVEGLSPQAYWIMGIVGAIGLFFSIVFHEFWHSLIARRFGLPMKGITLFIFGGIAELEEEPRRPGVEFWMAIAGPISSVVLGGVFFLGYAWGDLWPEPVSAVLGYLAFINWILAAFNMIPAFPLDGGRILRSALWRWKGDLRWATQKASQFGTGFGFVLIGLGILSFFSGNIVGGIWYAILGLFLRAIAKTTYKQVLIRETFENMRVKNLMVSDPVSVDPYLSIQDLVENYIYRHHFKMFPVVDNGRLIGCISTRSIRDIPREEWHKRSVVSAIGHCRLGETVSPDTLITDAMTLMNRSGNSRLMVVEDDRLVGIIALKDVLGALSTRMELEK